MSYYRTNIEHKTLKNNNYRKVLNTNKYSQLVLMSLLPYEEIGMEKHNSSQFIKVEGGYGYAIINNKKYILDEGFSISINSNVNHNIIAGKNGLKLYTVYSPPQHKDGIIEKYKSEEHH